jgi:phosphate-selective porin OprO/OprP
MASAVIGLAQQPHALTEVSHPAQYVDSLAATNDSATTLGRLAALEEEVAKLSAAQKPGTGATRPSFQMGGQLQVDYLYFGQDAASQATVGDVPDAIDVRRARLTARGEAFDVVEYAIGFDFALAGRPSFLDVWVGLRDLPVLNIVRVGHYFEPFSLERVTQNRYNTFMERSLADTFAPARNTGITTYHTIGPNDNGTWALGWFASSSDNFGDQFADTGGQALTGRATWLPYYDELSGGRSYVHVGGGYSFRTALNGVLNFQAFPEARSGAPAATNIPPFATTGDFAAVSDQLYGVEFAWIHGPLSFQTEFMAVPVDRETAANVLFHGGYAYVSYFLTGEHRPYLKQQGIHDRVIPFENFFRVRDEDGCIVPGHGAWEIAARWSYIDLTDDDIEGGVMHNYSLGLNWYLNPYTRVKWEYIHSNLDRAPIGDSDADIFGMRFDIDF